MPKRYKFPGDDNRLVRALMAGDRPASLFRIFQAARLEYVRAERILNLTTEGGQILRDVEDFERSRGAQGWDLLEPTPKAARARRAAAQFDLRALRGVHEIIGARFRATHREDLQPALPFTDEDEDERILSLWYRFLSWEVAYLAGEDPWFVGNVVRAVAFANTERGLHARQALEESLFSRYDLFPIGYEETQPA